MSQKEQNRALLEAIGRITDGNAHEAILCIVEALALSKEKVSMIEIASMLPDFEKIEKQCQSIIEGKSTIPFYVTIEIFRIGKDSAVISKIDELNLSKQFGDLYFSAMNSDIVQMRAIFKKYIGEKNARKFLSNSTVNFLNK